MDANASVSTETRILHQFPTTSAHFVQSTDSDELTATFPGKKQQINLEFASHKIIPRRKDTKKTRKWRRRPRALQEHSYLGKYPSFVTCPNCLNYIETIVRYYSTCTTHTLALSLLPFCLCIFPYQSTTFKDAVHYCPKCDIFLGVNFAAGKRFCLL